MVRCGRINLKIEITLKSNGLSVAWYLLPDVLLEFKLLLQCLHLVLLFNPPQHLRAQLGPGVCQYTFYLVTRSQKISIK